MKKILFCIVYSLLFFIGCKDDSEPVVVEEIPQLPINPENLNATWKLFKIDNNPLNDLAYYYIQFEGEQFNIYENLNSSFVSESSGKYTLTDDVISGIYDFQYGETWNYSYKITSLTEKEMIWENTETQTIHIYSKVE